MPAASSVRRWWANRDAKCADRSAAFQGKSTTALVFPRSDRYTPARNMIWENGAGNGGCGESRKDVALIAINKPSVVRSVSTGITEVSAARGRRHWGVV